MPRDVNTKAAEGQTRNRLYSWLQTGAAFPPLPALCFIAMAGLVYALLGIGQGSSDIAKSMEWATWKAFASFAIAIAIVSGILGGSAVWNATHEGGAQTSLQRRVDQLAAALHQDKDTAKLVFYIIAAVVLLAATFAFLVFGIPKTQKWPADMHIQVRTPAVSITIGLAAVPWLVLVWLLQERLGEYANQAEPPTTLELRRLWESLYAIVLAFAVFVVLALVPTGALRIAYFAGAKDPAANKQGRNSPPPMCFCMAHTSPYCCRRSRFRWSRDIVLQPIDAWMLVTQSANRPTPIRTKTIRTRLSDRNRCSISTLAC